MHAKSSKLAIIAILAVLATTQELRAEPDCFALSVARIIPVAPGLPGQIDDGVIVVRDGRIVAIGNRKEISIPPDAAVLEFPDATVTPGFVAAATTLGGQHRGDESIAAGYRAVDEFDLYGDYAQTLAAGVTCIHVNPGTHRLVTGQGAVVRLGGPAATRVLTPQADLTINLDRAVWNPPLDVTYSFPASPDVAIPVPRQQRPASRIGQLQALSEAIQDAVAGKNFATYSLHPPALAQAWNAKMPLRIRADRAADLLSGLRFLRDRERHGYLVGGAEVNQVVDAIRRAKIPLVYQPRNLFRSPGADIGTDPNALAPAECDFADLEGVTLAIASSSLAELRLTAARAARNGLTRLQALESITRIPAEILGVADRVGSLTVGKDADLVILTGDPLDVTSHVQRVFVRGSCVFSPPRDNALVIKAATVWAGPGKWITNGQILVEDGKIQAVGRTVPCPPFAKVINVPQGFVTPGFIDAHSHLGLAGDKTAGTSDLRLSKLVGVADVTDGRVAAAGITTVMLSPYAASNSKGAACAAVKTGGADRTERVIRDPAALMFDVSTADPTTVAATFDGTVAAGQKYLDSWTKYEKDLKEFLEKKAQGETTKAAGKDQVEEQKETKGPDPLTGTWRAMISGPMPEPVSITLSMQLTGSSVQGRIVQSTMGMTGKISGHFDGKHLSAEITPDVEVPGGSPSVKVELDLVKEDELEGSIAVQGMTLEVKAKRTDKKSVEFSVTTRRRQSKDGRPLPPTVDPSLEPLKSLLEKKIPAVVKVATSAQIREVIAVLCDKHKLPVVLINANGASTHAAQLADKKVTVVVPPAVLSQRKNRDYHQADDLSRHHVPIAFQSDAEDGARDLPAVVLFAVERGLDAETALEAMTVGAARALKIDHRVGTIEPGKDADLIIFNGHPFAEAGQIVKVVVNGKVVTRKEVRP